MAVKPRITRNRESDELLAEILRDDAMIAALQTALTEMWSHYKSGFADAGRDAWDPSPLLLPPVTNLLIALIEKKVEALKQSPQHCGAGIALEALSKKAGLYPVADDLLQKFVPDYTPISKGGQFDVVTDSQQTSANPSSSQSSTGCLVFIAVFIVIVVAATAVALAHGTQVTTGAQNRKGRQAVRSIRAPVNAGLAFHGNLRRPVALVVRNPGRVASSSGHSFRCELAGAIDAGLTRFATDQAAG